jgi:serine phosphatase RsbU (regulator of sigma subunit)
MEHWLTFLNQATEQIGADLDPGRIAAGFCQVAVPFLADDAAMYVADALFAEGSIPSGTDPEPHIRLVATAGIATGLLAQPGQLGEVVRARLPRSTAHGDLLVPLRSHGKILGLAMLRRRPGREDFDQVAILAARQLGAQTALTLHAAALYQREARNADVLQRSMLPTRPPDLPGVLVAYRYLPGNPAAQVGGDWFDAIPLASSQVALVVGDVMGHGIHSAAAMGRLRAAVQTLAALNLPPHEVCRHLDEVAAHMDENTLATLLYCVYDPVHHRLTAATAGHIPPVMVSAEGRAELLDLPPGAPIGMGGVSFESVEFDAPAGSVLVACTDGLVEVRGSSLSQGLAALCGSIGDPAAPLDEQCESLLQAFNIADREDDVALLMARLCGIPARDVAHWILEANHETPARARRLVRIALAHWGLSGCAETAELLVSELVTNAANHATRPIGLRLLRTTTLHCEVSDDDPRAPLLRKPEPTDDRGRGLYLVSKLAARWGVGRLPTGKVVWFELALPRPHRPG